MDFVVGQLAILIGMCQERGIDVNELSKILSFFAMTIEERLKANDDKEALKATFAKAIDKFDTEFISRLGEALEKVNI